ncbi:MAG: hypothetical protein ABF310_05670 [Paracoccaceae bacterium]|jgi:hypothetical protein
MALGAQILVDTSIFNHANFLKGTWQSSGQALWGGRIPIDNGQLITSEDESPAYQERHYLAALILEHRSKRIKFYTSDALNIERTSSKNLRPKSFGGANIFNQMQLETLETLDGFSFVISKHAPSPLESLRDFLRASDDEHFRYVLKHLDQNEKSNQDAWHLATVLRYDLHGFMTLDKKFLNKISAKCEDLGKRVVTPKLLCERLDVPRLCEDEFQSFVNDFKFSFVN